jgi:CRP/FNR family transcriptional regulator, nitrogen oxide reductase regulator
MNVSKMIPIDYEKLGQVTLFKDLPSGVLQDICREAVVKKMGKGSFFFTQGGAAEYQYLLLSGRVKLTQINADGQQTLMRAIGPYTMFGMVVLAQVKDYPVSAEATEDCAALGWTKPALMQILARYPIFAMNAIQVMAAHTQEFQERFRQMATDRVEQRLAYTLLRLASQTGKKTSEGVLIDFPLTRQDLGEMTGTTLYTVSRLLGQWEKQGLIVADREHILIRFPHGLVTIAES